MGAWRYAFRILTSTQDRHHPWLMQSLEKGTLLASEEEARWIPELIWVWRKI